MIGDRGILDVEIDYDDVDLIDRLDMAVHDTASRMASEINNQGEWIDYLLTNGWRVDEIAHLLRLP
jgi:hypothetical protein